MQSINVAVIHPLFLGVFLGTAAACAALAVSSLIRRHQPGAAFLLAGSLIYLVGTFLVTMVFHVPRNDALAAVDSDLERAWREGVIDMRVLVGKPSLDTTSMPAPPPGTLPH